MFWISKPLDKADYDTALLRCRRLLGWFGAARPAAQRLRTLEATILLMAGRCDEAEVALRQLVSGPPATVPPQTRWAFGAALAGLGRRTEAARAFESAVDSGPARAYADLAMLELDAGNTSRALDLMQAASESRSKDGAPHRPDAAERLYAQACSARVLAARSRFAEAAATVEQTCRHASRIRSKPARAGIYWRIGQAHLALKDQGQAMLAFENARQVDPSGYYGRLASEAIRRCQAATA